MATPYADHLFVRLLGARRLTIDEQWNSRDVRSTFWRLYFNQSREPVAGCASLLLNDGEYVVSPGTVHLVPAWITFSCRCVGEVDHFYIHFDIVGIPGPLCRRLFPTPFAISGNDVSAAIAARSNEIGPSGLDRVAKAARVKAALHTAIAEALDGVPGGSQELLQGIPATLGCLQATLQWIEDHLSDRISNDVLAERCGWSTDHFVRRFREAVGQTPARHVTERRVAVAAERLLFTDWSIDEIAESVGLPNRHYLSRVFSQKMGLPPAAYRRTAHV
jgi:AraC-like DNA-binding protein